MNTKITITSLMFLASIAFTSCMKEPMACFEPSKTTAAVNETITFNSSCTMDGKSYEWDFGDGTSKSTEANPSHAYANTGTYTVKMMAMSKNGKKMDETTKAITIQ